jgi:hypothetical protein
VSACARASDDVRAHRSAPGIEALLIVLSVIAWGPRVAAAADLFVDQTTGDDGSDGLSWATARASVRSALTTAAATPEPDVVSVAAGEYVGWISVPPDTTLLGGFPPAGGARCPSLVRTVLAGDGTATAVVYFGPGADGTVLDGFVVRGGGIAMPPMGIGGGVLVRDSAPLIRGNVIEGNSACYGGGLALRYSGARAAYARVEGNVIRRNEGPWVQPSEDCRGNLPTEFDRYDDIMPACGGVVVMGPPGVDLGVVLSGNIISENLAGGTNRGGGVCIWAEAAMEHDIVVGNEGSGVELRGGPVAVFNALLYGNSDGGVYLGCGGAYALENITVGWNAGTDVRVLSRGFDSGAAVVQIENGILWDPTSAPLEFECPGDPPTISSSIVRGGYPGGTGIIDSDPLFVTGPLGSAYLSQVAAGQATTSPAVDAGNRLAADVGLDQRTTATSSMPDAGVVDLGYHAPRVLPLTIERGTVADTLAPYRVVDDLPFDDDAGTLSDPALPLLFYRIPAATRALGVQKNTALDAVRLVFR